MEKGERSEEKGQAQAKSANHAENCLILLTRHAGTKNVEPPRIPRQGRAGQNGVGLGSMGQAGADLLTGQTCQSRQLLTEGVAAHNYADCRLQTRVEVDSEMQMQKEM